MFKRKFFLKLGLEIIAIIIGISASFWISEMSVERDKTIQRKRVLKSILIESNDIKDYCAERIKIWNQDIENLKGTDFRGFKGYLEGIFGNPSLAKIQGKT